MSSSYPRNNFMETDAMFLKSEDNLDNIAGGSSFVDENTGESKNFLHFNLRRRAQYRLLELECHVAINGRIPMAIAPEAEKPIFPHAVRFSQAIGVRTKLLDRGNLTIIVGGLSRFYNDSTSSLREKGSRSIMWSFFGKHTFELERSCRRPPRMRIIKCWNSNPSLGSQLFSEDEICDQVLGR
ncbi:CACTA en-spm transposon protein [Cucumis melo var. makuwa]|uniref:CACTA en-spm transposon protein n=1 Tax=Cucumis melo var. makuwa TaxID=1194695 RepID=A0A5D3BXE0_CUCMM|nr:CACTA en-spm transposon protein [Cucumis melo var. makuwa]TYK03800.1 CACTA en-spm transposon protein [Cucumis melo var. makuwa]